LEAYQDAPLGCHPKAGEGLSGNVPAVCAITHKFFRRRIRAGHTAVVRRVQRSSRVALSGQARGVQMLWRLTEEGQPPAGCRRRTWRSSSRTAAAVQPRSDPTRHHWPYCDPDPLSLSTITAVRSDPLNSCKLFTVVCAVNLYPVNRDPRGFL
jgi:hypothetical protein